MAVSSNSASGTLRRTAGLPTGPWSLCNFFRLVDTTTGSPFQAVYGFDFDGQDTAQFWFPVGDNALRWLARDGGAVTDGDVSFPVVSDWFFLALRWDGSSNVRASWRNIATPTLTHVDTGRPGFTPDKLDVFRDVFFAVTQMGHSVGLRWWNASLSDEELLRESRQLAPVRWGALGEYYRLRNAASAVQSYSGVAPFSTTGTLADAPDPPLPISVGAA